jgi:membrane protein DedA with SNARE-associated domain
LAHWIIQTILSLGYLGILVLIFVETIVPVIPSEVIMASAGIAVAHGTMSFWPLVAASATGATLGNMLWFTLGNRLGYERLEPLVRRHGRLLTLEWSEVQKGTDFLRRHGHWVVLALRISPVMRTMISLPAGLVHMRVWLFVIFTAVGTATWNGLWIAGGHWLAPHIHAWHRPIEWAIVGIIALILATYLWRVTHWEKG